VGLQNGQGRLKGRKNNPRFGTLLFLIPILLVVALVAYAVIDTTSFQDGTLIVRAQTSARYYQTEYLNLSVSVAGRSGITPFTLSLPQGEYTVSFSSDHWFTTPPPRNVNVTSRESSFAVGVYNPIPVVVTVNSSKFNATSVAVLHQATPMIWLNPSSEYEVISSNLTGRIIIGPMQNATYIFKETGAYAFSFVGGTSAELLVNAV